MPTAKKRSIRIHHHRAWCKQCGICIAFCPEDVYVDKGGYPEIVAPEKCTGCLQCEMMCPDFVITIEISKEGGDEQG